MKKSKFVAFSGILTALSVVILFLGSVISLFAYIAPIVAGLVIISAIKNVNIKSALIIFALTSLISLFLLPDKECPLTYLFFFGYYPIIKPYLEKHKLKFVCFILKFSIFNISIVISQLICVYVFLIPIDDFLGKWGIIILLALANLMFTIYDKMLIFVEILYMKKIYPIIKRLFK